MSSNSSIAQLAANKANAQASTGPVTTEGKARSSQNALTHGLTSKRVVLPGEDQAEFDALRTSLQREYKPATDVEREQVDLVAQLYWRLQRAYRVETAFLSQSVEGSSQSDPAEALARMFTWPTESKQWELVMRYIASAERAYNKALADLRRMQTERRKTEKSQSLRRLWVEGAHKRKGNGFVSQPPPAIPFSAPETAAATEPRL